MYSGLLRKDPNEFQVSFSRTLQAEFLNFDTGMDVALKAITLINPLYQSRPPSTVVDLTWLWRQNDWTLLKLR